MEVFSDEQLQCNGNCEESTFNMAILARSLEVSFMAGSDFPSLYDSWSCSCSPIITPIHKVILWRSLRKFFFLIFPPTLPGQRYLLTRFSLFPSFHPSICPFRRAYKDKVNPNHQVLKTQSWRTSHGSQNIQNAN